MRPKLRSRREEWIGKKLDKITFTQIFLFWIAIMIIFGLIYYVVPGLGLGEVSILDSVYYSFTTATATGFGDIIPEGVHRLLTVIEIIIGLTLLAVVTSKLVSIKQEAILHEIYEISLNEKINRLRSSFYLFRTDMTRLKSKTEDKTIKKSEIVDLRLNFSFLDHIISDVLFLLSTKRARPYIKGLDHIQLKLIMTSINISFNRIIRLVSTFKKNNIKIKKDATDLLKQIMKKNEEINTMLPLKRIKDLEELDQIYKKYKKKLMSLLN